MGSSLTMADAEAAEFDPNLKKKKKKKKKKVDEETPAEAPADAPAEVKEDAPTEEPVAAAESTEDGGFEGKKKKKKKKPAAAEGAAAEDDDDESFGTFDAGKMKKKKKPKKVDEEEAGSESNQAAASDKPKASGSADDTTTEASSTAKEEEEKSSKPPMPPWQAEGDRTMTYDEMLARIFSMLNPDISAKKAFKMKPPVVVREGTKRVVLVNFQEIVTSMNRTADHLLSFMLAELGTSGSTDSQGRVTFKYAGRQAQKHMESVIKQYVKEYVLCKLCKSSDTKLSKDSATRLFFMTCGSCAARRSVNPIKSGFQAQIGKRKKR